VTVLSSHNIHLYIEREVAWEFRWADPSNKFCCMGNYFFRVEVSLTTIIGLLRRNRSSCGRSFLRTKNGKGKGKDQRREKRNRTQKNKGNGGEVVWKEL
jgi:hypothetical protein